MKNSYWVTEVLRMSKATEKIKKKILNVEEIIISPKENGLLWFEMLKTLSLLKSTNGIISFPDYFEKACTKFSITKAKAWNCMFFLKEFGLIEIVKCHGIKLNYLIKNKYN